MSSSCIQSFQDSFHHDTNSTPSNLLRFVNPTTLNGNSFDYDYQHFLNKRPQQNQPQNETARRFSYASMLSGTNYYSPSNESEDSIHTSSFIDQNQYYQNNHYLPQSANPPHQDMLIYNQAPPPAPVQQQKKTPRSRGRRVSNVPGCEARMFTCKADNCGKVFKRSEHLKRHIRSIHTLEKRKFFTNC
jgi:hypothetical protein